MKMIVRFGVDACMPIPDSSTTAMSINDSDEADTLGNVNIPQCSMSTSTTSPAINIVRAGTQFPQDALVEMISRSVFYLDRLDWNELYPQLALSRTPSLRLGVHLRGEFIYRAARMAARRSWCPSRCGDAETPIVGTGGGGRAGSLG